LAWLVPGSGHFIAGQRARGLIFALTVHGLFALGVFIGGIKAIAPSDQPIWSVTQFMAGWPMLVVTSIQRNLAHLPLDYSPRVQDVGSVYCGIAGMLNLLVIFDAMLRLTGSRGPSASAPQEGR
jgi:hypothetical protein